MGPSSLGKRLVPTVYVRAREKKEGYTQMVSHCILLYQIALLASAV